MVKTYEGNLDASKYKFAIVVSRFNEIVAKGLLAGAVDCLTRSGAKDSAIEIAWVPGAFEIPLVAKQFAKAKKVDAVICLGAVIRGATPHFEYVAGEVSKGIANVSLDENLPIIFGVLTTDTLEQAMERAGAKPGNKGFASAQSAIELVNLLEQI